MSVDVGVGVGVVDYPCHSSFEISNFMGVVVVVVVFVPCRPSWIESGESCITNLQRQRPQCCFQRSDSSDHQAC